VREDIQVIVVDDCSPGAEKYKEQYPELSRPYLEFYSTPKGGSAGRARNIGIDHAKGKWLICMDADDLFVDNMENILDESKDRTEDILFYNYKTVLSEDITKSGHRKLYQDLFINYKRNQNDYIFRYYFDSMWGKIICNQMVQDHHIRCDETRYGNDAAFSFKCGAFAKNIVIIDKPFFIITEREGSLAASQFNNKKRSVEEYKIRLGVFLNIRKFVEEKKLNIRYTQYLSFSYSFWKDWPLEFLKYFCSVMLTKYFKYSIITSVYFFYNILFRRNKM
jgi:glycosyltransferase involved in cell wall biosynthesis